MGIRGELFSTKVVCDGRSYFFNVKENRMGDLFLNIVESKPVEGSGFDRHSVVVFKEDMRTFVEAFQKALKYIETGNPGAPDKKPRASRDKRDDGRDDWRQERGYRDGRDEYDRPADPEGDRQYARSRAPGRREERKPFAPRPPRPEGQEGRSSGFTPRPPRPEGAGPRVHRADGGASRSARPEDGVSRPRKTFRAKSSPIPAAKKRTVVRKKKSDSGSAE